jgi:DNA-binding CsgD family transcriptional regulator
MNPRNPAPPGTASEVHAASEVDSIIASIYRAAAGSEPWTEPLARVAALLDLWLVQFFAVNKQLGTILFSFEGGRTKPETAFDWFHKYHRIDPRAALVTHAAVGEWIACDEHFDEQYVARSRFYQEFLIPYGGRYVFGAKVLEDEAQFLVVAFLRGNGSPQLAGSERSLAKSLASHFAEGFKLQAALGARNKSHLLGLAVLDRMRQPLIVLDASRKIAFANTAGRGILATDIIRDDAGYATCPDATSDLELMYALRELVSESAPPPAADGAAERRGLRLRKANGDVVAATLLPLRPQHVLGAFGNSVLVLLAIYEPGAESALDPFLLQTTFDLTPAEARVAALLVSGLSLKGIAKALAVSPSTVRTQLNNVFAKTGAHRQADLVRVLLLASEF